LENLFFVKVECVIVNTNDFDNTKTKTATDEVAVSNERKNEKMEKMKKRF